MTNPSGQLRTIELVGGHFDGANAHVYLDTDGNPPHVWTNKRMPPINREADLFTGLMDDYVITDMYELDVDDNGQPTLPWRYRFLGETSTPMVDPGPPMAA